MMISQFIIFNIKYIIMMYNNYEYKYSKYKHKYKTLKKQIGGDSTNRLKSYFNDFDFDRWKDYEENHENSEILEINQKYLHIAKLLVPLIQNQRLFIMDKDNMIPWQANTILVIAH